MFIFTHTHTHTHTQGLLIGSVVTEFGGPCTIECKKSGSTPHTAREHPASPTIACDINRDRRVVAHLSIHVIQRG